jgi:DNA-binding GntR family transcriptional regulator
VSEPDAVARAHAQLRGLIVRGVLAPGSQLSQVELARRTGVSTTPLREALRRLEAEGLVESRPHRRPRVRPFASDDLDSVYAARVLLEPLAARITLGRLSEGKLAELRSLLDAMRCAAGQPGDAADPWTHAAWERHHHSFHAALIAAAPAPLREQIETLMARADRYRRIAVRADTDAGRARGDREHEAMVQAAEARDPQTAASLLIAHLVRSARTVQAIVVGEGELPALEAALEVLAREEPAAIEREAAHRRRNGFIMRPSAMDQPLLTDAAGRVGGGA